VSSGPRRDWRGEGGEYREEGKEGDEGRGRSLRGKPAEKRGGMQNAEEDRGLGRKTERRAMDC
jgi:hypothetical protein